MILSTWSILTIALTAWSLLVICAVVACFRTGQERSVRPWFLASLLMLGVIVALSITSRDPTYTVVFLSAFWPFLAALCFIRVGRSGLWLLVMAPIFGLPVFFTLSVVSACVRNISNCL